MLGYIQVHANGYMYIGMEVKNTGGVQLRLNGYETGNQRLSWREKNEGVWQEWKYIN